MGLGAAASGRLVQYFCSIREIGFALLLGLTCAARLRNGDLKNKK
jgi:hypothetical protein